MISNLISQTQLKPQVELWLAEDLPCLDVGGAIVGRGAAKAELKCKEATVLAGVPFVSAIFEHFNCNISWNFKDGDQITPCVTAKVTGSCQDILLAERIALNVLCRTAGIADFTAKVVAIANDAGWHGRIAATRKTTPGFRIAEKYAVLVGGGDTHRYDLSSMVILKDNHIKAASGNIQQAVSSAQKLAGFSLKIEVEAKNFDEAVAATNAGADIVMLDNFKPQDAKTTAKALKAIRPTVIIEVSGGINENTMEDYFNEHVDVLSMSKLTQGYPSKDFSLKIV